MLHYQYAGRFLLAKFKFSAWLYSFILLQEYFVFDWDDGNSSKSVQKHGVQNDLVESAFQDVYLAPLGEQVEPLTDETRYGIIAKGSSGDVLFVCFTLRLGKIRPISSRLANKKEREMYGKEIC